MSLASNAKKGLRAVSSHNQMTDFRRPYVRQLAINKAAEDINVTEQKIASRKLKIKTKVWICSSPGIKNGNYRMSRIPTRTPVECIMNMSRIEDTASEVATFP